MRIDCKNEAPHRRAMLSPASRAHTTKQDTRGARRQESASMGASAELLARSHAGRRRLAPAMEMRGRPAHSASRPDTCALYSSVSSSIEAARLTRRCSSRGNLSVRSTRRASTPSAAAARFRCASASLGNLRTTPTRCPRLLSRVTGRQPPLPSCSAARQVQKALFWPTRVGHGRQSEASNS